VTTLPAREQTGVVKVTVGVPAVKGADEAVRVAAPVVSEVTLKVA
jgi:hypothetical protein